MRPDLFHPDPFHDAELRFCGPTNLSRGERILLWMLRQWVTARMLGEEPGARLSAQAGGLVSARVAASFIMLMTALEERVRRPLCVSPPNCRGYADDEQRVVLACGVSPAAPDLAIRLLDDLVIAPGVVAAVARVMNFSLEREGLALPLRLDDPGPEQSLSPALRVRPTLH